MTIDLLQVAKFAIWVHRGDKRKFTGDPYDNHLARVAGQVMRLKKATHAKAGAGWCHDTVEDHNDRCGFDLLTALFGSELSDIVRDLTNVSKITHPKANRIERHRLDYERLRQVNTETLKIKLIDRIDNICEIDPKDGFARVYSAETLDLLEIIRPDSRIDADTEYEDLHNRLVKKTSELQNAVMFKASR